MGRPRNTAAERYPNGSVHRHSKDPSPNSYKRLIDRQVRESERPEHGVIIERLVVGEKITGPEAEAARRWATLVDRWYKAQGIPYNGPRSPNYQLGRADGGGSSDDVTDDQTAAILKTYRRARTALLLEAGADAATAVYRVVECNEIYADHAAYLALRKGLCALARHWGFIS